MSLKIAINGFGRIGRCVLRSIYEYGHDDIEIVAINDLADNETLAHLLRYDSVHGRFGEKVAVVDGGFEINGKFIRGTEIRNPEELPWGDVDIAFECTGIFKTKELATKLVTAGANKVIISAPGKGVDATVVYGVNHDILTAKDIIVSNASCTTNCLAPIAKVLNDLAGIKTGYMTTVHAYTGGQPTLDRPKGDLYRARAAAMSMIPTTTGATTALSLVLPELEGKLEGSAIRVPTPNVSLVDLSFVPNRPVTVEEIDAAMKAAAEGPMKGVLAYTTDPLVSIDFNHEPASSNYAQPQTCVTNDGLVRVVSWYDNEWGFANRMIDTARLMDKLG